MERRCAARTRDVWTVSVIVLDARVRRNHEQRTPETIGIICSPRPRGLVYARPKAGIDVINPATPIVPHNEDGSIGPVASAIFTGCRIAHGVDNISYIVRS